MPRKLRLLLSFAAFLLMFTMPCEVPAVPAFSRQIHADCRTCHFQNMRSLNRFGREFKQNGFRETEKMREKLHHKHQQRGQEKPND